MFLYWLIGLILNLIVVYLWRNSYFYEGGKYERIPLNMIVVIIFVVIKHRDGNNYSYIILLCLH